MAYSTAQRALRSALPPLFGGLALLAVSVVLFTTWPGVPASVIGALGSGLLLIGAWQLARARVEGAASFALVAFFWLWLGELVLRLWTFAGAGDPVRLLVLRAVLAAAALVGLSTGLLGIWRDGDTWDRTRALFVFQLACIGAAFLVGLPGAGGDNPTVQAVSWVIFVGPYAHLLFSLRRTARWVAARESVAEILTS
jgi:hypothetical protein